MAQDAIQSQEIQKFAALNPHVWSIGATPPFFNGNIDSLDQNLDFLQLIYFYNEPMGIETPHNVVACRNTVRRFFIL